MTAQKTPTRFTPTQQAGDIMADLDMLCCRLTRLRHREAEALVRRLELAHYCIYADQEADEDFSFNTLSDLEVYDGVRRMVCEQFGIPDLRSEQIEEKYRPLTERREKALAKAKGAYARKLRKCWPVVSKLIPSWDEWCERFDEAAEADDWLGLRDALWQELGAERGLVDWEGWRLRVDDAADAKDWLKFRNDLWRDLGGEIPTLTDAERPVADRPLAIGDDVEIPGQHERPYGQGKVIGFTAKRVRIRWADGRETLQSMDTFERPAWEGWCRPAHRQRLQAEAASRKAATG